MHGQRLAGRIRLPHAKRFQEQLVVRQMRHAAAEGDGGLYEVGKFIERLGRRGGGEVVSGEGEE